MLYAAPVWSKALKNKKLLAKLTRVQRLVNIRISSAYRTISAEGVGVIAGVPPIELLVEERVQRYYGAGKTAARDRLYERWQEKWATVMHAEWTRRLIPNVRKWVERPWGDTDYYITQALSGHGCFRNYLYNRRRTNTNVCDYCGELDDAEHTLFACPNWEGLRRTYTRETGEDLTATTMMRNLMASKEKWLPTYNIVRRIIETKEKDQRR